MDIKYDLNQKTIYQIFVRNYSKQGRFITVENDLNRIKDLGIDIIYLTPIHPIGVKARKGSWGSPYAIKDYFSISDDLGTLDEFKSLIKKIHEMGMQIIIDMVFNHTSPDNVILTKHPEYYYYKNGHLGNRCGDWSDVIDLDTSKIEVQDYLISVLKYWLDVGVDGFRFDVASIIPLSFFKRAREKLGEKPIFLAESVHPDFLKWNKSLGFEGVEEYQLPEVFDMSYCYNTFDQINDYLLKKVNTLKPYYEALFKQEEIMPKGYNKSTSLDNHDQDRLASKVDGIVLNNVTAYMILNKGTAFIYAGQEYKDKHKPELFEKDPIKKELIDKDFYDFVKKLIHVKKGDAFLKYHNFKYLEKDDNTMMFKFDDVDGKPIYGIFNFDGIKRNIDLDNGHYLDLISNKEIEVSNNKIESYQPLLIKFIC